MRAISLALSLAILHIIAAQRTPTISYITQEQIKDIGENVELVCSIQYAEDYPVLWVKIIKNTTDPVPLSNNNALIITDDRFSVHYEIESSITSTYRFEIESIKENDDAFYQCRIQISIISYISAEVDLHVRRLPVISDDSTQSVIVSEGDSVELMCNATGYPTPSISWLRYSKPLPTGVYMYRGNILRISAIKREHRGTYYCLAQNGVKRGTRRHVYVQVEFVPIVTASKQRLGQALQYDMDLECHIEAYPSPAITWFKNDELLSNNQHYSIAQFSEADEVTDSTIRVITIESRQYGNYTCRAQNKLGTGEAKIELYETFIPICPPACGISETNLSVVSGSSKPLMSLILVITMIVTCSSYSLNS